MNEKEMWLKYKEINNEATEYVAWAFCDGGEIGDELASLVVKGIKTSTASAMLEYELEKEEIPKVGLYNLILFDNGEAACIIRNTKISVVPFNKVSKEHAYKEGEGDRTLKYWRDVHSKFFTEYYKSVNRDFDENILCVLEEFEVVYK